MDVALYQINVLLFKAVSHTAGQAGTGIPLAGHKIGLGDTWAL